MSTRFCTAPYCCLYETVANPRQLRRSRRACTLSADARKNTPPLFCGAATCIPNGTPQPPPPPFNKLTVHNNNSTFPSECKLGGVRGNLNERTLVIIGVGPVHGWHVREEYNNKNLRQPVSCSRALRSHYISPIITYHNIALL